MDVTILRWFKRWTWSSMRKLSFTNVPAHIAEVTDQPVLSVLYPFSSWATATFSGRSLWQLGLCIVCACSDLYLYIGSICISSFVHVGRVKNNAICHIAEVGKTLIRYSFKFGFSCFSFQFFRALWNCNFLLAFDVEHFSEEMKAV